MFTLFFTEMWERMSYYGMRALLVLFMVDQVEKGGMGLTDETATAIYGLYTAGAYLSTLPGGWIADRLLGAQRAVWIGGIIIALGHFTLAVPTPLAFFMGLILVVLGTGLLKPNISTMVGSLYPEGGARRDAGFTLFYMGINLGGALGPIVCGFLGERLNWHYGFAAAGVGMLAGLAQFHFSRGFLGTAGATPTHPSPSPSRDWRWIWFCLALLGIAIALIWTRVINVTPVWLAQQSALIIAAAAVGFFVWAFFFAGLNREEKKRMGVIVVLFLASALFWSGFEQAGSSMNLFAERFTQRTVAEGTLGLSKPFEVPASAFQSLNSIFIIALAPLTALMWIRLSLRNIRPSVAVKCAWAMLLLGAGFVVLAFGSKIAVATGPVGSTWLITTYLLHTIGELFLSPVGLSSVTKLAPAR
ncbi:MAG: peptide MFS transporter, partial [Verrucomicrobia bacterium]|nr:peptide MFS transporter [Verrucomicrobiota bacterium]